MEFGIKERDVLEFAVVLLRASYEWNLIKFELIINKSYALRHSTFPRTGFEEETDITFGADGTAAFFTSPSISAKKLSRSSSAIINQSFATINQSNPKTKKGKNVNTHFQLKSFYHK